MKFLHTMIRVTNIEESLDFFCNKLGLVEIRRKDVPEGKFTLIFLPATEDEKNANESKHFKVIEICRTGCVYINSQNSFFATTYPREARCPVV